MKVLFFLITATKVSPDKAAPGKAAPGSGPVKVKGLETRKFEISVTNTYVRNLFLYENLSLIKICCSVCFHLLQVWS